MEQPSGPLQSIEPPQIRPQILKDHQAPITTPLFHLNNASSDDFRENIKHADRHKNLDLDL